jgi:hypothetical protein
MNSDQSLKTLPRNRKPARTIDGVRETMGKPELLSSLHCQGIALVDTGIDVLRLKGCESKKLNSLGISNLEQLANTTETALRAIPHFGILKVRRLKVRLNAYLLTLLSGVNPPLDIQPPVKTEERPVVIESKDAAQLSSISEFIAELEDASQSLDKLKKRIHRYVAELRKDQYQ